jgi:hypothetical protein
MSYMLLKSEDAEGSHDYITCKRSGNPWIGLEGSRRLRLPDFQAIGGEVVNPTHRPLLPPRR